MKRLVDNINSEYFGAVNKLRGGKVRVVRAYVEGYDDIAFWRRLLDDFESPALRFEISVPVRDDLAKGKNVVLKMASDIGENMILCVDSDFDWLFGDHTEKSRLINQTPFIFHTYAYSIENIMCYSEGLHSACVQVTKNDMKIFDFELFMEQYSKTIYPAFLWYAFSALKANETAFSLSDFRNIVKLHYVDLTANGQPTIDWVARQVKSKLNYLERDYPNYPEQISNFAEEIKLKCDVRPENCYMFMQGHTLMDNVVLVAMKSVCNKLKDNMITIITNSSQRGKTLKNELSNYNNSLRNIEDVIQTNMGFDSCPQYQYIRKDLKRFVDNFNTNRQ
jgi:hypothetical protein